MFSSKKLVFVALIGAFFSRQGRSQTEEILLAPVRALHYVTTTATNSLIRGQGSVIKRGDGTLVYSRAAMFRGPVRVEKGMVAIEASTSGRLTVLPYETSASLTNGLLLWVDASSNVVSETGAVSRWFDVRDEVVLSVGGAATTNYPWCEVVGSATPPTLQPDGTGRSAVDFGGRNSGMWLQWADVSTNALQLTNICSVVMALACTNGGGCFLGDAVTSHFARGSAAAGGSRHVWQYGVSSPALIQGDLYMDEERVDTLKATTKEGGQILSFIGRQTSALVLPAMAASNFGKDRAVETGGFRLYEVLIYNRVLTEAERMRVSEYLDDKWFGRSICGDMYVCSGTEVRLTAAGGGSLLTGQIQGAGTVRKDGDGDWRLARADTAFSGNILLGGGTVTNASDVWQPIPFAVDTGTLSVVAEPRSWRVVGASASGVIEKSGSGEWMVTGFPQTGLETLRVSAGTLRLAAKEAALPAAESEGPVTVFEDSFEFPYEQLAYSAFNTGVKYSPGVYGDGWVEWPQIGWTCRVNDPYTGTPRNPAIVLCNEGNNASLVISGGAEQGGQALLLSGKGELKRTVAFPADGDYQLSFWAAARSTSICTNHNFDVCLDGVTLTNILTTYSNHFRYYQVRLTNVTAGAHELRFTGTNTLAPTETYRASVLDAIRIDALTADDAVPVPDSGFEAGAWMSSAPSAPTDGIWQFGVDSGWTAAITIHSANLYRRGAPEGVKGAWIKNASTFAATNVTFGQAGTYALSFLAAARQTSGNESGGEALDGCWPGHDFRVYFNGVACGYGRTMNRRFERQELLFNVVAPGSYVLRFYGLNEGNLRYFAGLSEYSLTRCSMFDCVAIRKVDAVTVADYSFENNTGNWTWLNNGGVTRAQGDNYVSSGGVPDGPGGGGYAGIIMATGQFYQDVVFSQGGVFQLSFYAAGRFLYSGALDPKRMTASARLGHNFKVCVDGKTVIEVQTVDEIYRRYTARLPVLRVGTHRLSFEGINALGGSERGSSVDAVRLTAIATEDAGDLLPPEVVVEVAPGARLHLDYIGTNSVKAVKLGGYESSGIITAERFPDYIQGEGALYTTAKGTLISVY